MYLNASSSFFSVGVQQPTCKYLRGPKKLPVLLASIHYAGKSLTGRNAFLYLHKVVELYFIRMIYDQFSISPEVASLK